MGDKKSYLVVQHVLDLGEPRHLQRRRLQHPCHSPGTRFRLCAAAQVQMRLHNDWALWNMELTGHPAGAAAPLGRPRRWAARRTRQVHAWGWAYGVPQTSQGGGLAALAPARAKPDMATRDRPCSGRAGSATGGLANQGACSSSAYALAYASRIARTGVCIAYARMCPSWLQLTTFVH